MPAGWNSLGRLTGSPVGAGLKLLIWDGLLTVNMYFRRLVYFGKTRMKETGPGPVHTDLPELFERAGRAREEAEKLSGDYRFIVLWSRMRPRCAVRPSPMVDGED